MSLNGSFDDAYKKGKLENANSLLTNGENLQTTNLSGNFKKCNKYFRNCQISQYVSL